MIFSSPTRIINWAYWVSLREFSLPVLLAHCSLPSLTFQGIAQERKDSRRANCTHFSFLSYRLLSNTSHTAQKSSNDPYTCSIIRLSSRLWIRWPHPSPWVDVLRCPNNLIWHQLFLLLRVSPHQAPEACMALCLSDLGCLVPFAP